MSAEIRVNNSADGVWFELITASHGPLLASRRFGSLDDAMGGLEELKRHSGSRSRYRASHAIDGDCWFEFLDPSGATLATSCAFPSYKSLLAAEATVPMVQNAPILVD